MRIDGSVRSAALLGGAYRHLGRFALAAGGALCAASLVVVAAESLPFDYWGALLLVPLAFALARLLVSHARRVIPDLGVARLIPAALVVNLLVAIGRYALLIELYGHAGDAVVYDRQGEAIGTALRGGVVALGLARAVPGTGGVDLLTGGLYAVIGPTLLGGFFAYALLAFAGRYLFLWALAVAVPQANFRRYAILTLLFPPLVFWNGAIGKEAWLTAALGAGFLGIALMWTGRHKAARAWLVAGALAASLVRPHMVLLFLATAVLVALLGRRSRRHISFALAVRRASMVACAAALAVGAWWFLRRRLHLGPGLPGVGQVREAVLAMTGRGGSQFVAAVDINPLGLVWQGVSVYLRPFPWEAENVQMLITSLEGLALLALVTFVIVRAGPRQLWFQVRRPYPFFCLVYSAVFALAFASVANFGILARQRVQAWPMLLALLCLPASNGRAAGRLTGAPSSISLDRHQSRVINGHASLDRRGE